MSFSKIILVGNLTRDPELRYTPQGNPVCTFAVAVNERRKTRQGEIEPLTTFFRVTAWGRLAEISSQYLTRGKEVFVEGRLRLEEYTDREGNKRHSLEVTAAEIHFLSGSSEERDDSRETRSARDRDRGEETDLTDDDIPF